MESLYIECLKTAYDNFKKQRSQGNYMDNYKECFYSIMTLIHWMMDVIESVGKIKYNYPELRFINNQLKHKRNVIELCAVKVEGGLSFPENGLPMSVFKDDAIEPLFCFPDYQLKWGIINEADIDDKYKKNERNRKQFQEYQERFQGKDVFTSLENIYNKIINHVK